MLGEGKYTCGTASQTLEWIHAIIDFIKPYRFFLDAHVVNFFKDKLWETVDKEWIDCLRTEPVENLLQIPSGVFQDLWPTSLKNFIATSKRLSISRDQADLHEVAPNLHLHPLSKVLTQGMNQKKKHEVEALSAVVSSVARSTGANTVVDVGAGQGYLAQVLSFHYGLSVIAIDASSHHGKITDARAERIRKHYAAKMRDSRLAGGSVSVPKTVTCRILSTATLRELSYSSLQKDEVQQLNLIGQASVQSSSSPPVVSADRGPSPLLLAGLHACGDLSVTMLRSFVNCDEVKAVVSIGCCYNLLSERGAGTVDSQCGFPMSNGAKDTHLLLGKSSRDLACQSAARWRGLESDAGLHNFELHAFRAAFQMVLFRYYPETLISSPTIGRQGKALRRQKNQRILESRLQHENIDLPYSTIEINTHEKGNSLTFKCPEAAGTNMNYESCEMDNQCPENGESKNVDKYSLFEKFSLSGLHRLGLPYSEELDLAGTWRETESFSDLIGPYWSLRAALGPVLETILLLDRLLFLQEQGNSLEAVLLPVFDPALSPRNVALIAKKI